MPTVNVHGQSLILLSLLMLSCLVLRTVYRECQIKRKTNQLGCSPPPRIPQSERILGVGFLWEQITAVRQHRLLSTFQQRFERYGYTFSASVLQKNHIITVEPENVRTILSTRFEDYSVAAPRDKAFAPFTGRGGIFTSDGPAWQHSRSLLRPSFSREQISNLEALERHFQNWRKLLPRDDDVCIDLQPLLFRLTLDNATEFLFGRSVDSLLGSNTGEGQAFADAFEYAQAEMFTRYRLGPLLPFYFNRKFTGACKVARAFVEPYIQEALERHEVRKRGAEDRQDSPTFLDELTDETQDPEHIRTAVLNLLLAGRDTTASLLGNAVYVLSRRPDIWAKVQADVQPLHGDLPTYASSRDLTYIRQVIDETLRLYPSIPANSRFATKDTVLPVGGGPDGTRPIFVPKGWGVSYLVYNMHRRKDIFGDDAEEFKPERWETATPHWGYLPFNGGPRRCLGQQFAVTNAIYILARMAQTFSTIEYRGKPFEEKLSLSLTNLHGVKVVLKSEH